jgi:hypothetical protein
MVVFWNWPYSHFSLHEVGEGEIAVLIGPGVLVGFSSSGDDVAVGGMGVLVAGIGVSVGFSSGVCVAVGGTGVLVGTSSLDEVGVAVGGTGVLVGVIAGRVAVAGTGVFVIGAGVGGVFEPEPPEVEESVGVGVTDTGVWSGIY